MAIESLSDITKSGTSAFDTGGTGTTKFVIGTDIPLSPGEFFWVETDGNGNMIDIHVGKNA